MRGEIQNRQRAKQLRDYSGLLFGNITPTDIDGLIEYHGKGYVILELKLKGVILPYGQRLALERLSDDLNNSHKPTICIIASQEETDTEKDIDVANTIVEEYRHKGKWHIPKAQGTTKKLVEIFLSSFLGEAW